MSGQARQNETNNRGWMLEAPALRYILAGTSGILQGVAFPPLEWAALAWISLVPIYLAIRSQTVRRAAWFGWISGSTAALLVLYWAPSVIEKFTALPSGGSVALSLLLCGYLGLRQALTSAMCTIAVRRGWAAPLAFWVAHAGAEALFPTPFPWFLGTTLHEFPLLLQVAELGGAVLVSLIIVSGNLALVCVVSRTDLVPGVVHLSLVAAAALYGKLRADVVDQALMNVPTFQVGIVQPNLSHKERQQSIDVAGQYLELSRQLIDEHRVELLLWPETAVGAEREMRASAAFETLFTLRLRVPLVFGASIAGATGTYNSAFLSRQDGTLCDLCRYDKQVLFPFGEYIPGAAWVPALRRISPRSGEFVVGARNKALQLGADSIAVTICYEDIHPAFVRVLARDAGLLVNISNDEWFTNTAGERLHFALAKLRAVENRRFFVRAGNTGGSSVIDPVGRVRFMLPPGQVAVGTDRVAWITWRTFYGRVGDAPWVSSVVVLVLGALPQRARAWRWRRPSA